MTGTCDRCHKGSDDLRQGDFRWQWKQWRGYWLCPKCYEIALDDETKTGKE